MCKYNALLMGFMFEYPLFFFQKSFLPKWEGCLRCLAGGQGVLSKWCKNDKNVVLSIRLWMNCPSEWPLVVKEKRVDKGKVDCYPHLSQKYLYLCK